MLQIIHEGYRLLTVYKFKKEHKKPNIFKHLPTLRGEGGAERVT